MSEDSSVSNTLEGAEEPKQGFQFPTSLTVLAIVTIVVWVSTFFIPAGTYKHDADGATVVGTYQRIESPRTFGERVNDLLMAPVNGLYGIVNFQEPDVAAEAVPQAVEGYAEYRIPDKGVIAPFGSGPLSGAVGVFLFVLAMGAFMTMVFSTGALELAIARLAHATKSRGWLLLAAIMIVFALLGSTMGFAEETLGFYALLVPLVLALGYDRMTAAAMIILGATVGSTASTVNPFSIGVASGEAGVSIGDGIVLRLVILVVLTAICILYVIRYGTRVKNDPSKSIVGFSDEDKALAAQAAAEGEPEKLSGRQSAVLGVTILTFALLVFSVIPWGSILGMEQPPAWELGWWFPELTVLFVVAAVVVGFVGGLGEKAIAGNFSKGAGDFIGAGLVIMLARGVTAIMHNAQIIDTVLHAMETAVGGLSAGMFTAMVYVLNAGLGFLVPSSSGHAALAMPLLAPLGDFAEVSRTVVITAWANGSGLMRFISPTVVVVIGGLALAKVGYDKWLKFVAPLVGIIAVVNIGILAVASVVG